MNKKNVTYVAAIALGLTTTFANAQSSAHDNVQDERFTQQISHSFNNQAIIDRLSSSCTAQEHYRRGKVRPVMSPRNMSPAYKNQDSAFVILSPAYTDAQRAEAERLPSSIPSQVRAFLYNEGGTIVLPRNGLAEAILSRRGQARGYVTPGLYKSAEQRVYLPFMIKLRQENGGYSPFIPNSFHWKRLLNHETGHAIDDLLGNYLNRNAGRLTNRPDIRAAIDSDLAFSRRNGMDIDWRIHYFPHSHGGEHNGRTQLLRREVFAELWAEASGHGSSGLSRYYPQTFRIVEGIHDHLEALYKRHGTPCIYENDGRTVSPVFSANKTPASARPAIG